MKAFIAWLAVLLVPTGAFAEDWPPLDDVPAVAPLGASDVAVIVAVEDYLLLPDIPGAVDNANEWEVYFRNGMKIPNVTVLANRDVTREAMLQTAVQAAQGVGDGGKIWWIFIGHGAPSVDGKDGLLVGMDAQQSVESLTARGLGQKELLAVLEKGAGQTVMVVDACFSGRSADGEALAAGVQPVIAVDTASSLRASSVVLSAAQSTEVAGQLEGAARPAFSYLLLGALRGWADDGDGTVTAGEALYYAQRKLRGVKGRQQTPQGVGNLQLALASGVSEKSPRVVAESIEAPTEADGATVVRAPAGPGKAALTLEYLNRRLVFDKRVVRQGGRLLDGPAFYHAIGRPDLAAKWRSHEVALWLPGIAVVGAGLTLFVTGVAKAASDKLSAEDQLNDTDKQRAWFVGGTLGGFFTIAGGVSMIVFGRKAEHHPMTFSERRSAAEEHNQKLRDDRGLGPEVDWQNESTGRTRLELHFNPAKPMVGFSLRF